MEGIVYKSTGNEFLVKTHSKKIYKCKLKGKFRTKEIKTTNPISVGDKVKINIENSEQNEAVIYEIKERKNYIIRNVPKYFQVFAGFYICNYFA